MLTRDVNSPDSGVLCPYCKEAIVAQSQVLCETCSTPQHLSCWKQNGDQCSVYGCPGISYQLSARKPDWRIDVLFVVIGTALTLWALKSGYRIGPLKDTPPMAVVATCVYFYFVATVILLSYFWRDASWILKGILYMCQRSIVSAPVAVVIWAGFIIIFSTFFLLVGLQVF